VAKPLELNPWHSQPQDGRAIVHDTLGNYSAKRKKTRPEPAVPTAEGQTYVNQFIRNRRGDSGDEFGHSGPRHRRQPYPSDSSIRASFNSRLTLYQIDFVVHLDLGHLRRPDPFQDLVDLIDPFMPVRVATVDHVQQQCSFPGFIKRRLKRGDEFVWQIAYEPNGISQDSVFATWQFELAKRWIESGE
jgi:hypothetical protein